MTNPQTPSTTSSRSFKHRRVSAPLTVTDLNLARRIVLVGPPGSKRKEIALTLADALSEEGNPITCISVGDLINKEVTKHSDFGIEIEQSRETYSYVKDEIVI